MNAGRLSALAVPCAVLLALMMRGAAPAAIDSVLPASGAGVLEFDVRGGDTSFVSEAAGIKTIHVQCNADVAAPQVARKGRHMTVTLGGGAGRSSLPFVTSENLGYTIAYPASLKLIVHSYAGNVEIVRPVSPVEVLVTAGDVHVVAPRSTATVDSSSGSVLVEQAHGALDLSTDNGNITADLDNAWSGGSIRMESAAGDVLLTAPPEFHARIDASTENGKLRNALAGRRPVASDPFVWLYTLRGNVTLALR